MVGLFPCALDDMSRRRQCREAQTMRAGAAALKDNAGAARLILSFSNKVQFEMFEWSTGNEVECKCTEL